MCRKIIPTVVAMLTLSLVGVPPVPAQETSPSVDEAKAQISKLGTGPKSIVRITLKDKTKVQGWLSLVADDHFLVTNEKTGSPTEIKYGDVARIKSLKPSKGAIAAGIVAGVGVAAVIFLFAGAKH